MRKRLSSKLLAIILTLAICATTVLGCLMTVSAADSCYSFGEGKFDGDDLTQATIDVTFSHANLPNGISAGLFVWTEVDADADDHLVLKEVTAKTEGFQAALEEEENVVVFSGADSDPVELTLVFGFSNGSADKDRTYKIRLDEIELSRNDDNYYSEAIGLADVGKIKAACEHTLVASGAPLTTDDANGYSVYENSMCTKCGETFGYQLVPTTGELSEATESEGVIDLLEFASSGNLPGSTSPCYDTYVADNGESGESWDDPIIIDSAEEFVYLCKGSSSETSGKYYKVADGIAGFNLSTAALDLDGTLEDNLSIITSSGKDHSGYGTGGFQGHFDGNGVTVYGAWIGGKAYAGIFNYTSGNVTIKNLNVRLCYFKATNTAAGIVAYATLDKTNASNPFGSLTIENCSVADCYIESTGTGVRNGAAAIAGYVSLYGSYTSSVDGKTYSVNGSTNIKNCYVNLDEDYLISACENTSDATVLANGIHGGLTLYNGANQYKAENCIVIGVKPYTVWNTTNNTLNTVNHNNKKENLSNIYTDQSITEGYLNTTLQDYTGKMFKLDLANMKGSAAVLNMTALDWGTTWVMDGTDTYPRLATPGETFDTIYWDGTVAAGFSDTSAGTKDDPIIINTAAELAYLVSSDGNSGGADPATKITVTAFSDGSPKYFKIADGIKSIVLQPYAYINDIKALDSAAAVKSYFEGGSFTPWKTTGWEGATFCGHFDGNGATIYGMYATSSDNAALFCTVDGGAAFENLAIKNSYLTSSADNYQVGALFGTSSTTGYGAKRDGIIWVNNITIANNYMYNGCLSTQTTRSGVIGSTQEAIQVENALIYGNDATYGRDSAIYDMPLLGNCSNAVQVATDATYYDGFTPKTVVDNGKTLYYNLIKNSIILDCDVANVKRGRNWRVNNPESFENVYTNFEGLVDGVITFPDSTIFTYSDTSLKKISAADALGSAAKAAMPGLAWGSEWYCGTISGYPVQAVFATLDASKYSTSELTLIGSNVAYNDDGSFDFNFHFVPETEGFVPTLYVGTVDKSKFMKLDTATESCYADQLGSTAIMYTIPNLSARDIDLVWLPTLVTEGSAILEWGKSEQIAIADNAKAVIAGDYDTADKNVAAALINYGSAADAALNASTLDYDAGVVDLLEFSSSGNLPGSSSPYYDDNLADNEETGTSWDDPIIIDSAEEFVYLAKASGNDTVGKYYKVADGIAGFNLSTAALDLDGTLEDNLSIITSSGKNHSGSTPGFQGHFDGNGVTVYGAWTNDTWNSTSNRYNTPTYAGLFSCTKGDVTIKNVNVKLSYFVGTIAAGGIVGYHEMTKTATQAKNETTSSGALVLPVNGSLTIENCSVTECYIESQGTGYGAGTGAILGCESNSWADSNINYITADTEGVDESLIVYKKDDNGVATTTVDYYDLDSSGGNTYYNGRWDIENCYVNLESENFVSGMSSTVRALHGGVAAFANTTGDTTAQGANVRNCIVIGITPYANTTNTSTTDVQHTCLPTHFENVYTDQLSGSSMTIGKYNEQDFTGRVTQLTEAQLTGIAAKQNMPALDWDNVWTTTSGYPTFISKDYVAPTSGLTIYWDGKSTAPTSTASGDSPENAIIINTPSELAYIANAGYTATKGKYYRIADGIDKFVLQSGDHSKILELSSSDDVRDYFSDTTKSFTNWLGVSGYQSSAASEDAFAGCFDGNGIEIYGLYNNEANKYLGVFGEVDGNVTIENLTVKNAYMVNNGTNFGGAAIVGWTQNGGDTAINTLVLKNCEVANCYFRSTHTANNIQNWGILAGNLGNQLVMVENCIVYGNDAVFTNTNTNVSTYYTLLANGYNSMAVADYDGYYSNYNVVDSTMVGNTVTNTISIGTYPYRYHTFANRMCQPGCFENVYTDMPSGTSVTVGSKTVDYSAVITQVTDLDTLKGDAAQSIVDTFNTANGSTVWYVGATGDYPSLKEAGNMPSSAQTLYDAMILSNYDTVGDGTEYHANGTMSFGVYNASLNLKANPYMVFTFAFLGDYKEKRENIKIRFTYTQDGETVVGDPISVPAFDGSDIVNVDGWTHRESKNAGRYHTYRATDLPVEALANGIKVEASYNGGGWQDFGTYSVEGFAMLADNASKQQPCSYYATRYEAAKALLFYAQMLDARYGA